MYTIVILDQSTYFLLILVQIYKFIVLIVLSILHIYISYSNIQFYINSIKTKKYMKNIKIIKQTENYQNSQQILRSKMQGFSSDIERWTDGNLESLKDKVAVISGSSRGIGLYCAKKLARHGANIVIISKTKQAHPKLPGTIYTARDEILEIGGKGQVLAISCDLRKQQQVKKACDQIKVKFGKIDILINNASSIDLLPSLKIPTKKFDLMNTVNTRGSFMLAKYSLPLLSLSSCPYLINITPPFQMLQTYPIGQKGLPYIISKIGMSMIVLGIMNQYPNIKCCGLWPKKTVATAAVKNVVGTKEEINRARTCWIVADALYIIIKDWQQSMHGKFFQDQDIVQSKGISLDLYAMTNSELNNFHNMFKNPNSIKPKL